MQRSWLAAFGPVVVLSLVCLVAAAGCSRKKSDTPPGASGLKPGPVDPDAPTEFTTTPSGLKYRILRKSDGPRPGPLDGVAVHYRAWLDDGREFENSYHGGQAVVRKMTDFLPGWKEGLQLIGEGGMIELEVPEELGFGHGGQPEIGVPPHSTLHFAIELLEIARYQTEPGPVDPDAPEEFTTTPSGLQYRIRRRSTGKVPTPEDVIVVHVKAWLDDGTEVQNSYRTGFPAKVPVVAGLKGFVEGVQLIGAGGMIELILPPELALGEEKRKDIPPNSTIHYLIELVKVQ